MKIITRIALPLLTFIFLYSCTSSMSLTKRRYNHGYFVEHSHKVKKAAATQKESLVLKHTESKAAETPESAVTPLPANETVNTVAATAEAKSGQISSEKKGSVKNAVVQTKAENTDVVFSENKAAKPLAAEKAEQAVKKGKMNVGGAMSDTVMMILLIILALFLPWLSVLIKQDGITKWFWITLVLWILAGGLFAGGLFYGGLLALVAFVIALLVILDYIK